MSNRDLPELTAAEELALSAQHDRILRLIRGGWSESLGELARKVDVLESSHQAFGELLATFTVNKTALVDLARDDATDLHAEMWKILERSNEAHRKRGEALSQPAAEHKCNRFDNHKMGELVDRMTTERRVKDGETYFPT